MKLAPKMISRPKLFTRSLATASKLRPTAAKKTLTTEKRKYAYYDLVLRTPTHPTHPIESSLMTANELLNLKRHTKTRYEGNYSIDTSITPEERIRRVFGGRIKGEDRTASSRVERGEPQVIAGITVPLRPPEPDNCCMSGCINCVWELFEEDLKEWNEKREEAAAKLVKMAELRTKLGTQLGTKLDEKSLRWPENFHAPLKLLKRENYPESLKDKSDEELFDKSKPGQSKTADDEKWGDVPVAIRVFAEVEKKLKMKHKRIEEQQTQPQAQSSLA